MLKALRIHPSPYVTAGFLVAFCMLVAFLYGLPMLTSQADEGGRIMLTRLTWLLTFLLVIAFVAACSDAQERISSTTEPDSGSELDPVPTAGIPSGAIGHAAFRFNKPPSLDWQILDSTAIVVASHVSTTAAVETVPTDPPLYRPMHILKFRASEYLKGTGPNDITIEVTDTTPYMPGGRQKEYATREEAVAVATALIASHNSKWDSRSAVLFLSGPYSSVATQPESDSGASGASSTTTVFTLTNNHRTAQDTFKYTVDSLSRGWLPANSDTTSGATGTSGSEYLTNIEPSTSVSLADLRGRVTVLQTELNAGDGSDEYVGCVHGKYKRPWHFESNEELQVHRASLPSGAAADTEFHKDLHLYGDLATSDFTWYFTGERASLFKIAVVDDDAIDGSGFHYSYRTNRPLVADDYELRVFSQVDSQKICNHRLDWDDAGYYTWLVTVTAPAGTLHEAFFDPVTVGTAVGADATNGVLKPTAFTVGETATAMTILKWENNQAVLSLSSHVSLAHYALDFIELDGSASLTLKTNDATVDSAAGTHTWSVTTQPWHNGDKLMLRIRDTQRPPSFASETYNFTVKENASAFTIIGTALATDPGEGDEVLHTIESGNEGGKFQIDGWAGFILVKGALDYETKSSYTLTVKANDGKGGTDTATVNITIEDVAE